jgi:enoyl-CoA hydratase
MDEDSRAIVTEVKDSIAIIRFNQPRRRNPLSLATLQELKSILSSLTLRSDISVIVFTGTDDVFASGANIRELAQLQPYSAFDFAKFGQELFQRIANARPITIAAINGYCMGGALDLALACDIRVASSSAVFAHPGAKLGIITGWGGTQRLPQIIGKVRALELFTTARRFTANEALRFGVVSEIADPILECAILIGEEGMQKKGAGQKSDAFN